MKVMVVDDSAVIRQVFSTLLSKEKGIEVITASDGVFALEKAQRFNPDVVILDLEMPRMHGMEVLKTLMATHPVPVVVCSGTTGEGTRVALRAMDAGAVEVIAKVGLKLQNFGGEAAQQLVDVVKAAAKAKVRKRHKALTMPEGQAKLNADAVLARRPPNVVAYSDQIIAIGASTGGTEALQTILQDLDSSCHGIVIVQHMPEGFTKAFSERLNSICKIEVKEAEQGDEVRDGRALIAPGNHHVLVVRRGSRYFVDVIDGPLVSRHRPSVDVLFRSVAQNAGAHALGILLTGMGSDGAAGMLELRQAGAHTVAQDEASCVVFGMPREAIALNAAAKIVPLQAISREIRAYRKTMGFQCGQEQHLLVKG